MKNIDLYQEDIGTVFYTRNYLEAKLIGDDEGLFRACRNYKKRKHINYKQYIKTHKL